MLYNLSKISKNIDNMVRLKTDRLREAKFKHKDDFDEDSFEELHNSPEHL